MKTFKVIMKSNLGSLAINGLAASVEGLWRNCVSSYDGKHDLGFIDCPGESAEYLRELLNSDENVVEFVEVGE